MDAEMMREAVSRPSMHFVIPKLNTLGGRSDAIAIVARRVRSREKRDRFRQGQLWSVESALQEQE